MTVREQMAVAAMQGLLSQHEEVEYESAPHLEPCYPPGKMRSLVTDAVEIADLLITKLAAASPEAIQARANARES